MPHQLSIEYLKRRFFKVPESTPVQSLRSSLEKKTIQDDFTSRLVQYLEYAHEYGLGQAHIRDSCIDLAATLTTDPFYKYLREEKIQLWNLARREALQNSRPERVIRMKLDPLYFALILKRRKLFEGRSYHPGSTHNYSDMREGDTVEFTLDARIPTWQEDCKTYGLQTGSIMQAKLKTILFAPLVHWMYQYTPAEGDQFQPTLYGPSELLQLQRAGIYYTFPDYPDRISEHGFIGMELEDPKLVNSLAHDF